MITRAEHIAECKKRALAYIDAGNLIHAFTSMTSDLGKHLGNAVGPEEVISEYIDAIITKLEER